MSVGGFSSEKVRQYGLFFPSPGIAVTTKAIAGGVLVTLTAKFTRETQGDVDQAVMEVTRVCGGCWVWMHDVAGDVMIEKGGA